MQTILWPGATIVTGNRIADALMVFISGLNDMRPHAIVTLPRVRPDGGVESVRILCNRLSSVVCVPTAPVSGMTEEARRALDERELTFADVEWPRGRTVPPQLVAEYDWGTDEYS